MNEKTLTGILSFLLTGGAFIVIGVICFPLLLLMSPMLLCAIAPLALFGFIVALLIGVL